MTDNDDDLGWGTLHYTDDGSTAPATQAQREASWALGGNEALFWVDKDGKLVPEYTRSDPWLQPVRQVYIST